MPDTITLLLVAYLLALPPLTYVLLYGGRASADGTRLGAAYAALTGAPATVLGAALGAQRGDAVLAAMEHAGATWGMPAVYVALLTAVAVVVQMAVVPRLGGDDAAGSVGVWGAAAPPGGGVWWAAGAGGGALYPGAWVGSLSPVARVAVLAWAPLVAAAASWVAVVVSDAGVITDANVGAWAAAFPPDGLLFPAVGEAPAEGRHLRSPPPPGGAADPNSLRRRSVGGALVAAVDRAPPSAAVDRAPPAAAVDRAPPAAAVNRAPLAAAAPPAVSLAVVPAAAPGAEPPATTAPTVAAAASVPSGPSTPTSLGGVPSPGGGLPLCRTCRRPKPARSKHSRVTGHCVAVYDHYCGWVANDVAALNRRLFLTFLAVHVAALAHGAGICASLVRSSLGRVIAAAAFRVHGTSLDVAAARHLGALPALQLALYVDGTLLVVGAAFAAVAAMLAAFGGWHAKMVARGETTNENAKWGGIADAAASWDATHGEGAFVAALTAGRWGGRGGGMRAGWAGGAVNVYDRGVVANVLDVLAPERLLRRGRGEGTALQPARKAE